MVEREREGEVGSMLCDRVFDWKTTIRWYVMFMTSLYRWRQETRRYTYAHDPLNKSISLSFCCVDRQEIVRTTQFKPISTLPSEAIDRQRGQRRFSRQRLLHSTMTAILSRWWYHHHYSIVWWSSIKQNPLILVKLVRVHLISSIARARDIPRDHHRPEW